MRQALVVEQDRDILTELEPALITLGFQVTVLTESGETEMALEQERYQERYEVAFLNFPQAGSAWRQALMDAKRTSRATTFVFITRDDETRAVRSAMSVGLFATIDRPITRDHARSIVSPEHNGLLVLLRP